MASGYQTEGYATDVIRLWTDSHQFRTWKSGVTSVEAKVRETLVALPEKNSPTMLLSSISRVCTLGILVIGITLSFALAQGFCPWL